MIGDRLHLYAVGPLSGEVRMRKEKEFHRGDVFFVSFDDCDRSDWLHLQFGPRPVVIIQNDIGCLYSDTVTVIPLTAKLKKIELPTHYILRNADFLRHESMAITEQIGTINKRQAQFFIGKLNKEDMHGIENAVMVQLGLNREKKSVGG